MSQLFSLNKPHLVLQFVSISIYCCFFFFLVSLDDCAAHICYEKQKYREMKQNKSSKKASEMDREEQRERGRESKTQQKENDERSISMNTTR